MPRLTSSTHPLDSSRTEQSSTRSRRRHSGLRVRWAAIGAAIAVTLGAGGGFGLAQAVQSSGERSTYTAINPCRLMNTRAGDKNVGPRDTKLGVEESLAVAARGQQGLCAAADLPADATALQLNVTALGATAESFLTFWPGGTRPRASSLNPVPGAPPTPNAVTVPLSSSGSFSVYNNRGSVDIIIDVVGYYTDHNHDDRYYTRAQIDSVITAFDKVADRVADLEQSGNDQVLTLGRLDFNPFNIGGTSQVRRSQGVGAYIPSGAGNAQLWAPVHVPTGSTITGVNAQMLDTIGGTSLEVELRVNGITISDVQTSGSNANQQVVTDSVNVLVATGDVVEVRVQAFGNSNWAGVGNQLQIVKYSILYDVA